MYLLFDKYLITPLFLLLIVTAVIGVWMSTFLFKRREKPGVIFLSVWTMAAAVWSFTYAFEYSATEVTLKILWSKLSYLGIVFCPVSFFFFTLSYSSRLRHLKRKYIIITYFIAVLFILGVLTNDLHHLHWRSVSIYPETNTTEYTYGILFWLFFAFTYFFLFSGVLNLYLLYFKFPKRYKSQIGIFMAACVFPIAGNISYISDINPIPGFDWTPLSFMLSGTLLSINFRFGIFDLVPFARNKLFDVMPDGVMVIDDEGRIADLNPSMAKQIGKAEKEVIGKSWWNLFPEWKSVSKFEQKRKNSSEFSIEKEGKTRHFTYQSTSLFDKRGGFSGKLVNIRDITDRKNAENNIQRAYEQLKEEIIEKEKLIVDLDAFAHTVAHDLKNIVGAIITSGDLMRVSIQSDNKEEAEEVLDLIEISSKKMLHITQELLILASVRQQEIQTEILDMCHIVDEAIARNYNLIQENKVQLIIPDNCLPAKGYGPWIEDVWANYISNAIKYGGNPPVIEFGSEHIGKNMIKFWIKDNGNGIPEDQQKRLFRKFTRLQNLKIEGQGLGLSIVKRIIDKLGGTVGVESTATPGEGSTFYFTLPAS
jgi:PAS domain S-box-containing protein